MKKEIKTVWQDPETKLFEVDDKSLTQEELDKLIDLMDDQIDFIVVTWDDVKQTKTNNN